MEKQIKKQIFSVAVRHMPMGDTFTLQILAQTLEEAKQKAVEWHNYSYRAPGVYEYLTLA